MPKVIISASYKTDIPTFYGDWFMHRLRAGYCKMINPYNRAATRVSLERPDVDGFVFWTKNIGPFLKYFPEIRDRGFPFVVQHTINGYPRALEYAVVNAARSVENLRRISEEYGPRVAVWRYDTIIMSSVTPMEFHLRNFESLCRQLRGAVDEVVISFVHLYKKTLRNMQWAAGEFDFAWEDPSSDAKRRLATELVQMAGAAEMRLSICSQHDYIVPGAHDARCIDADRLESVSGHRVRADLRGNRKECGCFASRDIGDYDTCPHGCVYCYAVLNREVAQQRFKEHDPLGEFLFKPSFVEEQTEEPPARGVSLPLFEQRDH